MSGYLILLLGIGTAFNGCWLFKLQKRVQLKGWQILAFSVLHTVWGVFSVKVFAIAESGFNWKMAGNMSLFGGVFFMPIFYFAGAKLLRAKPAEIFDAGTVCMLFTLMCARINCILSGCCQGAWIGNTGCRWPTREAELVYDLVAIIVLGRWVLKREKRGEIYTMYMISYGIFRFVSEGFRASEGNSWMHLAHIWALLSMCIGASLYWEMEKKGGKKKNGRRKTSV